MANQPSTGTLFQVNISSVPTNIPNTGVAGFGAIKTVIENSPLEATAKTFIDDVPDPGSIKTKVFVDHASTVHGYLFTAANTTGQVDTFIISPKGTTKKYTFSGIIMSYQPDFTKGATQMADLEVKLTGPVALA